MTRDSCSGRLAGGAPGIGCVGDAIAAPAQRIEGDADEMLEPVAGPIQPLLTPDQGQQPRPPSLRWAFHRRLNHGISPSSGANAYGQMSAGSDE
jgi:hypothetical protein